MNVPKLFLALCGAAALCGSLLRAGPTGGGYRLIAKYDLGAAPGGKEYWDYMAFDPSARRLYISHNTEVKVVEADTGKIVGSIADLKRVHGIALIPQLAKGFISDGGADEAVVFDFKTLQVRGHIKTDGNPDCIIYDTASKHIHDVHDVQPEFRAEIEHFFQVYKDLERHKTETRGFGNRAEAEDKIAEARARLADRQSQ